VEAAKGVRSQLPDDAASKGGSFVVTEEQLPKGEGGDL